MNHLPALITDLALILSSAAIVTLVFKRLRQPVVLGYILAGFLVGPHLSLFPEITQAPDLQIWADLGVIFLLFALGLEFSFKKLSAALPAAGPTALIEVPMMLLIGLTLGKLFGWSSMDAMFLGGILAISSTTIIVRAFEELGWRHRAFVNLVFGLLIVEDLVAVLLLVVLSTLAISRSLAGTDMLLSMIKLGFFLTLWFLSGIFLIPTFLKRAHLFLSQETLLIVALALCLIMVVLATKAGFSPALGAFIMGSVLAETAQGAQIEHVVKPVRDLFAAVFFVSVGMMIDPHALKLYAGPVLVIAIIFMVSKVTFTTMGAIVSGQSLRHSMQTGLSVAQIGEFSFIIASLGLTLKVTSDFLYPIAVAVSVLTTFATPYLMKSSDAIIALTERHLPAHWRLALAQRAERSRFVESVNVTTTSLKVFMIRVIGNSVMIIAIFLGVSHYVCPLLAGFQKSDWPHITGLIFSLVVSAPFVWALVLTQPYRGRGFESFLELARWMAAGVLLSVLSSQFVDGITATFISLGLLVFLMFGFSRRLSLIYDLLEARLMLNFEGVTHEQKPRLAPWDGHLVCLTVAPESSVVGNSLQFLAVRERFGVMIALIERGAKKITAPSGSEMLLPNDRVWVIGDDQQISNLQQRLEDSRIDKNLSDETGAYVLQALHVDDISPYLGRAIRDSGVRETLRGIVVGIERAGQRFLNPDSQMMIESGDVLWIVGDRSKFK